MSATVCLILAAGQGKRMKSAAPKVLHEICGKPMLWYPIHLARSLGIRKIVTVVGHGGEEVKRRFSGLTEFAWQKKRLGTADAVLKCAPLLKNFDGHALVLCGDAPLLRKETVKELLLCHDRSRAHVTILTATMEDASGYGRIVRDSAGNFETIREEKDATPDEREIREINTGAYVFDWTALKKYLNQIRAENKQREFYLTDAPLLMRRAGLRVETAAALSPDEAAGINTRVELSEANRIMNQRLLKEWGEQGITIVDTTTTFIEEGVKIGTDTTIYPFTYIEKDVTIGKSCSIGPFAKIRSGSVVRDHAAVGSFVEIVRSDIGSHTNVKHLTYLGDAKVGSYTNIGAGTITANFNGKSKNKTIIGSNAFIGCDTVLVAPVKIGNKAKTGAGAVIPRGKNVKAGDTVIGIPARSISKKK